LASYYRFLAAVYLLASVIDITAVFHWISNWPPLRTIDGVTTAIFSFLPLYPSFCSPPACAAVVTLRFCPLSSGAPRWRINS
jgi:hypothetical protein